MSFRHSWYQCRRPWTAWHGVGFSFGTKGKETSPWKSFSLQDDKSVIPQANTNPDCSANFLASKNLRAQSWESLGKDGTACIVALCRQPGKLVLKEDYFVVLFQEPMQTLHLNLLSARSWSDRRSSWKRKIVVWCDAQQGWIFVALKSGSSNHVLYVSMGFTWGQGWFIKPSWSSNGAYSQSAVWWSFVGEYCSNYV